MSMTWNDADFVIRESYHHPPGKVAAIRHILVWNKFESLCIYWRQNLTKSHVPNMDNKYSNF